MSLLHNIVQEMAAAGSTGAHAIATTPGSLFSGGIIDPKKSKSRQRKMIRRIMNMKESLGVDLGRTDFDASDVISRIDAASKKAEQNDDTTAFGLEDEDGNMVKVYIRNDQSEEFEKELSAMLAGADEDDDNENSSPEIAEVLFKLKDKFDIVDVEWPGIEGDVEEEQEVGGAEAMGAEGGMAGGEEGMAAGGEEGMAGGGDEAMDGDLDGIDSEGGADDEEMMPDDDDGAKSALSQVIDMMKADAEAKKAEADARTAEARAKEAEYSAQSAGSRVRKEEQIYDMEEEEKRKSNDKKEAEQLAKLARFQHQKAQDSEVKLSMESKEDAKYHQPYKTNHKEDDDDCDEISMKELSYLIMRNLGHNS